MVSSAVRSLTPWLQPGAAALPGATASTLSHTVCRMAPLAMERPSLGRLPAVSTALGQLVGQSMALRSPTGGWPADLPQTPDHLAPYLSEEIGDLLDALDGEAAEIFAPRPDQIVPVPSLVPHLLWMLASGGYEIMRLIEGVQARIEQADRPGSVHSGSVHSGSVHSGSVHIVRLVPVLSLTAEGITYDLDLVTQTDPTPARYLADTAELRLLDNDLASQSLSCGQLLSQIVELVSCTQPGLQPLLSGAYPTEALRPFHPWQPGTLHLQLHLANLETLTAPHLPAASSAQPPDTRYLPPGGTPSIDPLGFTLDDFANTLVDSPESSTAGVLGDWLTFTDEGWIQAFLETYAHRVLAQHLPQLLADTLADTLEPHQREARCNALTYRATDLVQGANGLFKHTFVHEPVLVADLWPRLRWYLAQSSERVMQLMGGVSAQVLPPGLSWQQGSLYLRPLMQLTTGQRRWIVDLGRGRLLPTHPQALPEAAAVDVADDPWAAPLTVADLTRLIDHDLSTYAPALATLRQGTAINLHRLDTNEGCQPGQLSLAWCFTLQTTL
ncbi:MAG TPA: hypothetical protein VLS96_05730 [Nodosilinea sp.]|nr:hypothetical protein [Nodosilinea sp.]